MKRWTNKSVMGVALGERSLVAAEIVGGERPALRKFAEMQYPEGVTPLDSQKLGAAFAEFSQTQGFSARNVVVGLPAKWLVVKPKDVPAADDTTLANMLRLQAEAEFSTELKDLVYDFAPAGDTAGTRSVLLVATPRKYVDAATAICEAANLNVLGVTSSALVLGAATGRQAGGPALVLTVSPRGAELTAQRGESASTVRHLRAPQPTAPFVSELRRAVSTIPTTGTGGQEMILWDDGGVDAHALSEQLGLRVRAGDLPILGIDATAAGMNGHGQRYAAAASLALAVVREERLPVDFLHSRLAPPREQRVPPWAYAAAATALVLVIAIAYAFINLHRQQADLDAKTAQLNDAEMKKNLTNASDFVSMVSFAKGWHGGDTRYLGALRELTSVWPEDGETYAMNLVLREPPRPVESAGGPKAPEGRNLIGQLSGRSPDQPRVQELADRMRRLPDFVDVKSGGTQDAGRSHEVSFMITFTYVPPSPTPATAKRK